MPSYLVGANEVAPFAGPFGEQPPHIVADTVRGNDNVLRTGLNAHDADELLHIQQSAWADRPAPGTLGRVWLTNDLTGLRWWYDDGGGWVVIDTAWFELQSIDTSMSLSVTRAQTIVLANTSSGNITITLPSAAMLLGRTLVVKKTAAANTLTIDANGSETIDGALTLAWTTQYQTFTVTSDGTNIYII